MPYFEEILLTHSHFLTFAMSIHHLAVTHTHIYRAKIVLLSHWQGHFFVVIFVVTEINDFSIDFHYIKIQFSCSRSWWREKKLRARTWNKLEDKFTVVCLVNITSLWWAQRVRERDCEKEACKQASTETHARSFSQLNAKANIWFSLFASAFLSASFRRR